MIPITKPTLSPYKAYEPKFKEILESGLLTNSKYVAQLEEKVRSYVGTKYCIAVSSCTAGMMLVLKGLGVTGEVIVPSFTFSATGHVLLWNDIKPIFAEIDRETYTIDPKKIEALITSKTTAILATQLFGNVCNVAALQKIATKHHLKLIFDAAHGLGSHLGSRQVGSFGDAEIFSCSPTKLMTTGEGGLITTGNKALAEFCRIGRNYGDNGTYNTAFNGLNARMSEFHAVVGLESMKHIDRAVKHRNKLVTYYQKKLLALDQNIEFQKLEPNVVSTYKDFSILIDPKKSGYTRDQLCEFLKKKNIISKKYFYPPLHQQDAYKMYRSQGTRLPITDWVADNVLSLPLYSHMSIKEVDEVLAAIKQFYANHA